MRVLEGWLRIVLSTLALLGIFVVVSAILYGRELRLDLTPERRHTLSEHARRVLDALDADVELIAFLRTQDPRNPYIQDLLRRIGGYTPRVRWRVVDVNRYPATARQYGVTAYGALVVESAGRRRVFANPREETVMWAILQVTRRESKTVYFVSGHGERAITDRDRLRGYSYAAATIEQEFYLVRMLVLPEARGIPEDATVLVIAGPEGEFRADELELLDGYLRRGGRLLVMLDPFACASLARFLGRFGVVAEDDAVVDPGQRMAGGEYITMRVPVVKQDHPIVAGLAAPPVLSLARSIEAGEAPAGIEPVPFLRTSAGSWATRDREVAVRGITRYEAARDRSGPITVGVEVRLAPPGGADDAARAGRLIVYGNSDFANNFFLDREGNADFLVNTINWLADEEGLIAPRPPRKEPGREQLLVLGTHGNTAFWLAAVAVPGMWLLMGCAVYLRQRYGA
jgi:ABC-type uncharacterized transport system involved in gliding motility auxiliary subunit